MAGPLSLSLPIRQLPGAEERETQGRVGDSSGPHSGASSAAPTSAKASPGPAFLNITSRDAKVSLTWWL